MKTFFNNLLDILIIVLKNLLKLFNREKESDKANFLGLPVHLSTLAISAFIIFAILFVKFYLDTDVFRLFQLLQIINQSLVLSISSAIALYCFVDFFPPRIITVIINLLTRLK